MSVYTAGEIVVWLVLAAALGVVLGWLLGTRRREPGGSAPSAGGPRGRAAAGPATDVPSVRADAAPARSRQSARGVGAGPAFRGSASPGPGGGSPGPEYVVKANVDSMTYHVPGTPTHRRVTADVWFKDVDAARAAGFRPPPSQV